MIKMGIKNKIATMIECVGPLWISAPVKKSKIMSTSGSIERTSSYGTLILTCSAFEEPLPKR
jgi:hypothetical protein